MAPRKKNTSLEARKQPVVQRADLIQHSRQSMSLVERKAVSYVISKVKPGDDENTVYKFDCQEFFDLMRWKKQSYSDLRAMMVAIAQQTFVLVGEDGSESIAHWFNTIHIKYGKNGSVLNDSNLPSRYIEITIHKDMMPYLFNLDEQRRVTGQRYITYQLQNITLMKHTYSQTLYELCKSHENYKTGNTTWIFEFGTDTERDIRVLLALYEPDIDDNTPSSNSSKGGRKARKSEAVTKMRPSMPKSWNTFTYFERDVLRPAKEEINKYTDIMIDYEGSKIDLHGVKHRRYVAVKVAISTKTAMEKAETERYLDGMYRKGPDGDYHQLTLDEFMDLGKSTKEEEHSVDEIIVEDNKNYEDLYPIAQGTLKESEFTPEQIYHLIKKAIYVGAGKIKKGCEEMWAIEYVSYYIDYEAAHRADTKTTPYKRVFDLVSEDRKHIANKPGMWSNVVETVDEDEDKQARIAELEAEIARLKAQ